jgi:hypothetical protein
MNRSLIDLAVVLCSMPTPRSRWLDRPASAKYNGQGSKAH